MWLAVEPGTRIAFPKERVREVSSIVGMRTRLCGKQSKAIPSPNERSSG